ncbi:hypothetical protein AGOR_G00203250 [Albula goreensis]|uniref:SKICH domain-containing protein n=1 Tax=Albula goreensis TaxID=1534307 RepID=A0A8T3CXK9_9TELE|nr:hypothetical protein AGOR_G00203250 [Albula goreensis]
MSESAEGPPTSNVMEVSTYSQVVFNEVPQSFTPNTSVKCDYIVTSGFEPHRRDWVGIFKVGWGTTREYYTFVWAVPSPNPGGQEPVGQHVLFDAYYLPKEDGEFYQFCYVDSGGQVRGASTPFRFENPPESSLEYMGDNDLLVITTQEQVEQVEREKEELHKEMEKQQESMEALRSTLDERELEIRRLREANEELGQLVSRMEQEQAQSKREREEERERWASQQRALQERETQTMADHQGAAQSTLGMEESLREMEELQQSVSTWQEKYERAVTKINQMKQERAELREKVMSQEERITHLSSSCRDLEQEKEQAKAELRKSEDHITLLQVDLQSSQKETVKLAGELRGLRAQAAEGLHGDAPHRSLTDLEGQGGEALQKQAECVILTSQLQEAKAELGLERQNSEEARSRADLTIQNLQEEKQQLEHRLKAFEEKDRLSRELEMQLAEARRNLEEQASMREIVEQLYQENKDLRTNVEKLQVELAQRQAGPPSASISLQHPNPYVPSPAPPGAQSPQPDSLFFGNPFETPAIPNTEEELRVCRYCQEIFPDISLAELEQHEGSHKVCPFCTLICDPMEQNEFEQHVYSHEE